MGNESPELGALALDVGSTGPRVATLATAAAAASSPSSAARTMSIARRHAPSLLATPAGDMSALLASVRRPSARSWAHKARVRAVEATSLSAVSNASPDSHAVIASGVALGHSPDRWARAAGVRGDAPRPRGVPASLPGDSEGHVATGSRPAPGWTGSADGPRAPAGHRCAPARCDLRIELCNVSQSGFYCR